MKLMTKAIEKTIPALYATEEISNNEKNVVVKFFTPDANWSWYVVEGEKKDDGDWLFFGLVDGFEKEWGYFTLNELKSVRGKFGLPVERDLYFSNVTIDKIMRGN